MEVENELRHRLLLFTPCQRRALLRLLLLPDSDRADVVAKIWASEQAAGLSELLMDLQDDRFARILVMGVLAEMQREP
jgi:hypothetical protein